MIRPWSGRLAPLLASLAVGAVLAGALLTLALDPPQAAPLDGAAGTDLSVAPTRDVPIPAAPGSPGAPPGGVQQPTVAQPPLLPRVVPPRPVAPAPKPGPAAGPAAAVVAATNAERLAAGCGALRVDNRLAAAAAAHSADMAAHDFFSHVSTDGRRFADRIVAAGYPRPGAENIAQGQPTAATVVAAWMASPGHRANILNCGLTAIGVGFDPRGNYWTQDLGF